MRAISLLYPRCEPRDEDFESLFRQQYPAIVRHAARVLGDPAEAEEAASEAFVRLMRERRGVRNPEGWLRQCALRLALDRLRSNLRRGRRERLAPSPRDPETPEQELIAAGEQQRVRQVLAALPDRDAALLLGRADGLSYQELAESNGIRPTSVGAMIARAERRFKEKYEEFHGTK